MLHSREDYQKRIQDSANLIPEDEPVFLIRAQDATAVGVLNYWLDEAQHRGAEDNILEAAEAHRNRIIRWQKKHGMKIPDMP